MNVIKVDKLKPGISFSSDVYIDPYNKLMDKEKPLTRKIIDLLREWKISEIQTEGEIIINNNKNNGDVVFSDKEKNSEVVGTYIGSDSKIKTIDKRRESYNYNKKSEHKGLLKSLSKKEIAPDNISPDTTALYKRARKIVQDSITRIKKRKPVDQIELTEVVDKLYTTASNSKRELLEIIFSGGEEKYDYVNYLYSQHVDTCIFSMMIAKTLKMEIRKRTELGIGALLHDIGMFIIPKEIIEKVDELTEEEYDKIKTHPFLGYKVLIQLGKLSRNIAVIALHHHEMYNGSGYPKGLSGNNIYSLARIVNIASVYASLVRMRTYRESIHPSNAVTKMLTEFKTKFDPKLLNVFLKTLGLYPPSTYVLLSNGGTGQVIENNPDYPKTPRVHLLFDKRGIPPKEKTIIDLSVKDVYVKRSLSKFEFEKMIVDKHEKLQG